MLNAGNILMSEMSDRMSCILSDPQPPVKKEKRVKIGRLGG